MEKYLMVTLCYMVQAKVVKEMLHGKCYTIAIKKEKYYSMVHPFRRCRVDRICRNVILIFYCKNFPY